MKYANSVKAATAGMIIGSSLFLAACGSSDSGTNNGSNGTTTISGTAATGAAMTSGTVDLSCKDGLKKSGIAISATGTWSTTVPTANLPCAVKASDGTSTYYSFTVGNGSSIVSNVTPLTTMTLARILGATPASLFATLSATDLAKLNTSAINAAITALNAVLANYALPANFNPVTTPLIAAATGQAGNDYDGLLDQFKAALGATTLDSLITTAATGTMPTLATPSYTPAATDLSDFFTTFAGTYTLKVNNSGAEGTNNAAAKALFPQDAAISIQLKSNGDVTVNAVGRTINYLASTYAGNTTGESPYARTDFAANESGKNVLRYRSPSGFPLDLYISYAPSNGEMQVDVSGFVNNEGYASLRGNIVAPPASLPTPAAATCSSGDDKLVFTNGPTDFCGFTRNASATTIAHYFQFTSAAGSSGVTYVKFETNSDDSAVEKVTIENDDYAFGCGGALAACTGVSISSGSSYKQFTLSNTALAATNGASTGITVNGLLIHPVSTAPAAAAAQPITLTSIGNNKGSSDIAPLVGAYTGNLGMALTPDAPTVKTNTCSIEVLANGKVTVSAGEKSISATFDGGIGDNILNPSGTYFTAVASDLSLNNYVRVSLQRGYITKATASHSTDGLLDSAPDRIDCLVFNPNPTTLGSSLGSGNLNGGATASDLPSTYAGTYSNGTCSLTISNDATFTVTVGSNVVTAQLAGDEDDRVSNNTSEQVYFLISDSQADIDGKTLRIQDVYRFADGHFQIGSVRRAATTVSAFSSPACGNLVKM